jgi:hypothetical protein
MPTVTGPRRFRAQPSDHEDPLHTRGVDRVNAETPSWPDLESTESGSYRVGEYLKIDHDG